MVSHSDSLKGTAVPFSYAKKAVVVGAGIAGACAAHALRQHGAQVRVIDQTGPAAEASGNPAGLVMPRLDLGNNPIARFHRQAFAAAIALYDALGADGFVSRGVLDRHYDATKRQRLLAEGHFAPTDMYEQDNALFHALGGAIAPARTIGRLLDGIDIEQRTVTDLAELDADIIVLACGRSLGLLTGTRYEYRCGQVDWCAAAPVTNIMDDGYVTHHDGNMIFGASFDLWPDPTQQPVTTAKATAENIERLRGLLPDAAITTTQARASLRVSTRDRMPVAGHVQDNIYCVGALGARGLTTAPLLGQLVACQVLGLELPLDDTIAPLLNPQRLLADRSHMQDVG